jgi:hypothetical protein
MPSKIAKIKANPTAKAVSNGNALTASFDKLAITVIKPAAAPVRRYARQWVPSKKRELTPLAIMPQTQIKQDSREGNAVIHRDLFKRYAMFRCTKVGCSKNAKGKGWKSAHGWDEEPATCEQCGTVVRTKKEEAEANCELDMYICHQCENRWDCLHDPMTDKIECDHCGAMAERSGTQKRHAIHFWFECPNCSEEWEEAQTGRGFSQRCQECHSAGEMLGMGKFRDRRVQGTELGDGNGSDGWGYMGGTHDVEGCDMCQELKRKGIASSCTRKNQVRIQELANGDVKYTAR